MVKTSHKRRHNVRRMTGPRDLGCDKSQRTKPSARKLGKARRSQTLRGSRSGVMTDLESKITCIFMKKNQEREGRTTPRIISNFPDSFHFSLSTFLAVPPLTILLFFQFLIKPIASFRAENTSFIEFQLLLSSLHLLPPRPHCNHNDFPFFIVRE